MAEKSQALVNADIARAEGSKVGFGTLIFGRLDGGPGTHPELITIGKGCLIASEAVLLCHGYPNIWDSITIGDNCYIGFGALILPGAVIGSNCVIGARAVVSHAHPFPDWSLIVGNPARVKRSLNELPRDIERHKIFTDHMKIFEGM